MAHKKNNRYCNQPKNDYEKKNKKNEGYKRQNVYGFLGLRSVEDFLEDEDLLTI